jgi:hypothetical protein
VEAHSAARPLTLPHQLLAGLQEACQAHRAARASAAAACSQPASPRPRSDRAPPRAHRARPHMRMLVRLDADCHCPCHHLASRDRCGRPAWTGLCRVRHASFYQVTAQSSKAGGGRQVGIKANRIASLVAGHPAAALHSPHAPDEARPKRRYTTRERPPDLLPAPRIEYGRFVY